MSEDLQINSSNYNDLKKYEKTPPWIDHIKNFIKKRKITPEKLYWLIVGEEVATNEEKMIDLPKLYIHQTKKRIQEYQKQIRDLEEERNFLRSILQDALKLKNEAKAVSQHAQHNEGNRQHVGKTGKNVKRPATADP